ncbi:MAG: hypothetical protein LCH93_08195 [Proteobacteria bacterium]|nr:hypothetical protein [Pseudomonadota bacterium]
MTVRRRPGSPPTGSTLADSIKSAAAATRQRARSATFSVFRRWAGAAFLSALAASLSPARAEVDTEHMFGFSEGTDIGTPFLPELESELVGRFGSADGSYSAMALSLSLKYPLSSWFRVAPTVTVSRFDISGMSDIEDRGSIGLEQLGIEFRLRPFDRENHLFGLTFVAMPFVGFVDPTTGAPGDSWGTFFLIAADREIVPGILFAALNLSYGFGEVRNYSTGLYLDGSELAFSAAATARLWEGIYLGGEVRYRRGFDALAFGNLTGQAVFLGPTFYATLGKGVSLSGAWNIQAWGQTTGLDPALDVALFQRQMFKLRLAIDL